MSMNGRKAKMALVALRPVPDCPEPQDSTGAPAQEFPPPPEEAERIISTLLPHVSILLIYSIKLASLHIPQHKMPF